MLRASEFQPEYGLIAAGGVKSSFIGRLPGNARALGPVAGVSYRVASRIANTLRAGTPARTVGELDSVRLILFHSPAAHHKVLIELLKSTGIHWESKSLVFCDCEADGADYFQRAGASVTTLRNCAIPGRMVVEGSHASLAAACRLVRRLKMKPIEISAESALAFQAAITLATGALTPLIDHTVALLRRCGLRDGEAMRLAAALFQKTAREYSHSGRQSSAWHGREPDIENVLRQIGAVTNELKPVLGEMILVGLKDSSRHPEIVRRIRAATGPRIGGCP